MKNIYNFLLVLLLCTKLYAVNDNLIISEAFPEKLSDFSFFKDSSAQIPHEEVIPYELISTLFSDYSYKQRWVYVPKNKNCRIGLFIKKNALAIMRTEGDSLQQNLKEV